MAETLEEALQEAGSKVLSHLGSKAHKLTWDEVMELTVAEPVQGEHRVYDGPYEDVEDQRNAWTAYQDMGISLTKDGLPPEEEEKEGG